MDAAEHIQKIKPGLQIRLVAQEVEPLHLIMLKGIGGKGEVTEEAEDGVLVDRGRFLIPHLW